MIKEADIKAVLNAIEDTEYASLQSIDVLLDYGIRLSQWNAMTGEAVSEAKRDLHLARRKVYADILEKRMPAMKLSASLLKEYVTDSCSNESAFYELCERANRATVHTMDMVRTAVSALKQQAFYQTQMGGV